MVMTKRSLSPEAYESIEDALYEQGYLVHEYVLPNKNIETHIACPLCGEKLHLYVRGQSHKIYCNTDFCIDISVRGL